MRIQKTVGVIGGMGPAATADFLRRLVDATAADDEAHHLRVVVDSDPTIPSRAAYFAALARARYHASSRSRTDWRGSGRTSS